MLLYKVAAKLTLRTFLQVMMADERNYPPTLFQGRFLRVKLLSYVLGVALRPYHPINRLI